MFMSFRSVNPDRGSVILNTDENSDQAGQVADEVETAE
jgi:hypothetical protein